MKVVLQDFKYGRIMRPGGDYYIGDSIALYGEYCEAEIDIYRQCVHKDDYVLDIGANIGACTIPLAQMVGANGRVYAFEPQRAIFQMLCGNVVLNNLMNVYTMNVGIGAKKYQEKIKDIFVNEDCVSTNIGNYEIANNHGDYEIDIISVDELNLSKCNFIKCDTENMGFDILLGAEKTIKKFSPVIYLECEFGRKGDDILNFLNKNDYSVYKQCVPMYNSTNYFINLHDIFRLDNSVTNNTDIYASFNWLCVPRKLNYVVEGLELVTSVS